MVEYKVLESNNVGLLTIDMNRAAEEGWVVSFFSAAATKSQYVPKENLFACVMERESEE